MKGSMYIFRAKCKTNTNSATQPKQHRFQLPTHPPGDTVWSAWSHFVLVRIKFGQLPFPNHKPLLPMTVAVDNTHEISKTHLVGTELRDCLCAFVSLHATVRNPVTTVQDQSPSWHAMRASSMLGGHLWDTVMMVSHRCPPSMPKARMACTQRAS